MPPVTPDSASAEFDPLLDLNAPVRSFRLLAIEQAMTHGTGTELLQALQRRLAIESDEECRTLLDHAIPAVTARLATPMAPPDGFGLDAWVDNFQRADPSRRIALLAGLSRTQMVEIATHAPTLLEAETNSAVTAVLLRIFGGQWPAERLKDLGRRLWAPSLAVRLAALEILCRRAPKNLLSALPRLLGDADPRTRTLAIRGLIDIDLEEAVAHLEHMLTEGDDHARGAALQCAFYFPFDRIKAVLLTFIAATNDVDLIRAVGLVLQVNHDPAVPFRLWELAETAQGAKAAAIRQIQEECCRLIEQAGKIDDPGGYPAYRQKLRDWTRQRAAVRFVQEVVTRLDADADGSAKPAASPETLAALQQPALQRSAVAALAWPLSPVARTGLTKMLATAGVAATAPGQLAPTDTAAACAFAAAITGNTGTCDATESVTVTADAEDSAGSESIAGQSERGDTKPMTGVAVHTWSDLEGLSPADRSRTVAAWQAADAPKVTPILHEIFANAQIPDDLRATALRSARRMGVADFVDTATTALRGADPTLLPAAIEYLGRFDIERLLPTLGRLITSANLRVKMSAVRVLQEQDPGATVARLAGLLTKGDPRQHSAALACLARFDFTLVRPLLTQFLLTSPERETLDAALCLFEANPDPQNLEHLVRIEDALPTDSAGAVAATRARGEQALVDLGLLKPTDLPTRMATCRQRRKAEVERRRTAPAYALSRVRQSPSDTWRDQMLSSLQTSMADHPKWWLGGLAIIFLAVLGLFVKTMPTISPPSTRSTGSSENRGQPVPSTRADIAATVINTGDEGGGLLVRTADGTRYILQPQGKLGVVVQAGDKIKATIYPIREFAPGVIIARVTAIKRE